MHPQPGSPDRKIAAIASRQHGVVAAAQLLEAGVSHEAMKTRLRNGALHRVHRGVYRVGHEAPNVEARYLAAVLACGSDGAALSHLAAAHLLRIVKGPPPAPEVSTLVAKRHPGITTHKTRALERCTYRGVPTTTAPRTLVDLAPLLPLDDLARACHEAEVRHRVQPEAVMSRATGREAAWKLRAIFEGDHPTVLSRLESLFLDALRRHGLPRPETNRRKGAHYVDCRWARHRLTVELDSYRFHHSRHAWEQDRRRERAARARGDEFRRYTWADVAEDPAPMLGELGGLLARLPSPRRDSSVGRAHD